MGGSRARSRGARTVAVGSAVLGWLGTNVVLGYVVAVPLGISLLLVHYMQATLWNTGEAPIEDDEVVSSGIFMVTALVLLGAALLSNLAWRGRPILRRLPSALFWSFSGVLLVTPFLVLLLGELTVNQFFGRGVLW